MDEHRTYTINKPLLVVAILCIYSIEYTHAQWTKKDSARLQNILSGKETLQLDPEVQKAIENGTFLNFDKPADQMRMSTTPLTIIKDFSEYLEIDDTIKHKRIALKDLPPAVFMRYGLDKPLPKQGMMVNSRIIELDPDIVPLGKEKNTGVGRGMDFNALLSNLFSKNYRQLEHNKKHATSWKSYNNIPTIEVHNKQRKFRTEHPEAVLPLVKSTDPTKIRPLIKDSLATDTIQKK
ncbi:DUF4858 domain-containing protein [Parabacteroides chinchillae]|uniref:DUF4858 domain-containing protein n=1 Tax=Parabacteroides chinchillae TaxID=871327 RepID=A0A8G2FA38_9BACT|nr:DUF4858 domain-containing protein [Parabacteroides chinchillae]SEF67852.1 protein of unknown function [Parabacteroides chinchillae]